MCRSAPGWRGREHDCGSSTCSRCATSPSPRLAAEAFSTHCPSATAAGKVPFSRPSTLLAAAHAPPGRAPADPAPDPRAGRRRLVAARRAPRPAPLVARLRAIVFSSACAASHELGIVADIGIIRSSATSSRRRTGATVAPGRPPAGPLQVTFGAHDAPSTLLGVTVLGYRDQLWPRSRRRRSASRRSARARSSARPGRGFAGSPPRSTGCPVWTSRSRAPAPS